MDERVDQSDLGRQSAQSFVFLCLCLSSSRPRFVVRTAAVAVPVVEVLLVVVTRFVALGAASRIRRAAAAVVLLFFRRLAEPLSGGRVREKYLCRVVSSVVLVVSTESRSQGEKIPKPQRGGSSFVVLGTTTASTDYLRNIESHAVFGTFTITSPLGIGGIADSGSWSTVVKYAEFEQ